MALKDVIDRSTRRQRLLRGKSDFYEVTNETLMGIIIFLMLPAICYNCIFIYKTSLLRNEYCYEDTSEDTSEVVKLCINRNHNNK